MIIKSRLSVVSFNLFPVMREGTGSEVSIYITQHISGKVLARNHASFILVYSVSLPVSQEVRATCYSLSHHSVCSRKQRPFSFIVRYCLLLQHFFSLSAVVGELVCRSFQYFHCLERVIQIIRSYTAVSCFLFRIKVVTGWIHF